MGVAVKPVTLPGPGDWTLTPARLYNNVFLLARNPEHEPRVVGRTAQGEVFVRVLTDAEKAMVG